jgi:hypothetical protein
MHSEIASPRTGGRHSKGYFVEKFPHLAGRADEIGCGIYREHSKEEDHEYDDRVHPIGDERRLDPTESGVNQNSGWKQEVCTVLEK